MLWDWGCPFLPYSLLYLQTWHVVVDFKKCLPIIKGISGDFRWESFWNIWTNLNENQRAMFHIFTHGVCIARGRQTGVSSISLSRHKSKAFLPDPEQHRDAERWPIPTPHCCVAHILCLHRLPGWAHTLQDANGLLHVFQTRGGSWAPLAPLL